MKSYINFFRNYANFKGYLKRGEYWSGMLVHLLVLIGPLVPAVLYFAREDYSLPNYYIPWVLPIWCCYFLLTRIPLLAAAVRRLRTLPRNGWWLLVGLIPVAGWFIILIWLLQKGNYDRIEKRMSVILPGFSKIMAKPQQGGWFFAALALLAAGGFFLNRQVMRSEKLMASVRDIQNGVTVDLSALMAKTPAKGATEQKPADVPVVLLDAVAGEPITALKDGSELLLTDENVLASKYAVTVAQYQKCVAEKACDMPVSLKTEAYQETSRNIFRFIQDRGLSHIGEYFSLLGKDGLAYAADLPMVNVTAAQAEAYCEWAGMRLPTVQEWREAAATDESFRTTAENSNCTWTDRSAYITTKSQLALTVPVTAFADRASDYGMVQMAGNVWELTAPDEKTDTIRVLGGAWNSYPDLAVSEASMEVLPGYASNTVGFRCFADSGALLSDRFSDGKTYEDVVADVISDGTSDVLPDKQAESPAPAEERLTVASLTETGVMHPDVIEAEVIEAEVIEADDAAEEGDANGTLHKASVDDIRSKAAKEKKPEENADQADSSEADVPQEETGVTAAEDAVREEPVKSGLDVSAGLPVIAKKDGSVLFLTRDNVLASIYTVTVEQYKKCVEDGSCVMPDSAAAESYTGSGAADEKAAAKGKLPMVYVTRQQAADYCAWIGMRLPTAEEWKAAAEMPADTVFSTANVNCVGTSRVLYTRSMDPNVLTIPVTAFRNASSVYGMVQMAGNVWEWTAGAEDEALKAVAMGGAWNSYPAAVGPDAVMDAFPSYAADNVGFRCFVNADSADPELFEISDTDLDVLLNPELWSSKGVRAKDEAPMVYIPASTFKMGVPNSTNDEKPVHEVTLSAYWIDAYEVTNAQYALCVAEGVCTAPQLEKSFRHTLYFSDPEFANYPVIAVDRNQAQAYCEWAGTRLPTEAEWEFAAKGPEGNVYPWGNTFDSTALNYSGNGNYDTLPVDGTPKDVSAFGVYNLGGNVSEWVYDRYDESWYGVTDQPVDPTGPEIGSYYVIRGGSAQTADNNARAADRFYAERSSYGLDRGFRCAIKEETE